MWAVQENIIAVAIAHKVCQEKMKILRSKVTY